MNIDIQLSQTRREARLASALVDGFKRHGINVTAQYKLPKPRILAKADLVVFIGVKSRKVRDACLEIGVPYLLIDKGYFNRGRYHRFALNGFTPCYLGKGLADQRRFNSLNIRLADVRVPAPERVTFIGFDNKYAAFHGIEDASAYADDVNRRIAEILRSKPTGTSLELFIRNRSERSALPFSALLPSCHCVVVHGSIAAVEAIIAGVPVVSLGGREANVVHDLSNTTLESILAPKQPSMWRVIDRLAELAWCQFTNEEIGKGLAWGILSEQYRRL